MDPMAAIRETFFEECAEQLAELEAGLLSMEAGTSDKETVNAVFRAVHSIKGGAGAFALATLVELAHSFETALDLVRNDRLAPTPEVLRVMLRAADLLSDTVRASRAGTAERGSAHDTMIANLTALANLPAAAPEPAAPGFQPIKLDFGIISDAEPNATSTATSTAASYRIVLRPHPSLYAKANEATLLIRELERLGTISVTCDSSRLPPLEALVPDDIYLAWIIQLTTERTLDDVREVFEFVEGDCELTIEAIDDAPCRPDLPEAASATTALDVPHPADRPAIAVDPETKPEAQAIASSIRVDLERVDRLVNLIGELVISYSSLSQRAFEAATRNPGLTAELETLGQLTREIQDSAMAIRAQPLKPLFQRMSRIVREVAEATGKRVQLRTEGENTEVDRTVIEKLADPLTHMIRNAIDHGIETPQARRAAGKPEVGEVRLSAAHRSGRVAIEIADDGAGINHARVRAHAVERGLISADAQLTDGEIEGLLFLPGFSTAESVSAISGRGVGMDAVKRAIQALGGRIAITSKPGQGSTFTLSLPLTLALLDGMVVTAGEQTMIVPLAAIIETLKPKQADVFHFGSGSVVPDRGGFTAVIDLARELGFRDVAADYATGVLLLVEAENGARKALLVDSILDQRQVVIKGLDANYGSAPGVAAATILGDGRIGLILDVDAIVTRGGHPSDIPIITLE